MAASITQIKNKKSVEVLYYLFLLLRETHGKSQRNKRGLHSIDTHTQHINRQCTVLFPQKRAHRSSEVKDSQVTYSDIGRTTVTKTIKFMP